MAYKETRLKILLLEDDGSIGEIVSDFLEECGYTVVLVEDGHDAVDRAYESHFDLFIFDVKVPSMSGFEVLKEIRRSQPKTPAIFMTSLSSIDDISRGYNAGCDDYIKKPFELRELELRLEKLIEKSFALSDNRIRITPEWSFELHSGKLTGAEGEMYLSNKESKIVKTLLSNQGAPVSHEQLMNEVWGYDDEVSNENLRTHIKKLRKILGKEVIVNIRKQGYMIAVG